MSGCVNINWEMVGAIGTCAAVIVALFGPLLNDLMYKPKIKFDLIGPNFDKGLNGFGSDWWHIDIYNSGKSISNAGMFLVKFKTLSEEKEIPPIRLKWPYEDSNQLEGKLRHIVKFQRVDLFAANSEIGILQVAINATILPDVNDLTFMELGLQLIGEGFQSKEFWVRITKVNNNGDYKWLLESFDR